MSVRKWYLGKYISVNILIDKFHSRQEQTHVSTRKVMNYQTMETERFENALKLQIASYNSE